MLDLKNPLCISYLGDVAAYTGRYRWRFGLLRAVSVFVFLLSGTFSGCPHLPPPLTLYLACPRMRNKAKHYRTTTHRVHSRGTLELNLHHPPAHFYSSNASPNGETLPPPLVFLLCRFRSSRPGFDALRGRTPATTSLFSVASGHGRSRNRRHSSEGVSLRSRRDCWFESRWSRFFCFQQHRAGQVV